jgi:hypothetical protein
LKEKKTGLKAPLIPATDFSYHNLQAFSPAVRHLMQAFLNVCRPGSSRGVALEFQSLTGNESNDSKMISSFPTRKCHVQPRYQVIFSPPSAKK